MTQEQLLDAIRSFYGNTALSRSSTRDGLEEARDEITLLLETLADEDQGEDE